MPTETGLELPSSPLSIFSNSFCTACRSATFRDLRPDLNNADGKSEWTKKSAPKWYRNDGDFRPMGSNPSTITVPITKSKSSGTRPAGIRTTSVLAKNWGPGVFSCWAPVTRVPGYISYPPCRGSSGKFSIDLEGRPWPGVFFKFWKKTWMIKIFRYGEIRYVYCTNQGFLAQLSWAQIDCAGSARVRDL